jgi:hypothetical protein
MSSVKKIAPTAAMKRVARVRALGIAEQNRQNNALKVARSQWKVTAERGPLVFEDRPTPEELGERQRREELRGLPLDELCENIAENEERRREEQRAIVVPNPEGDAAIEERIQRAHDRRQPEPPSG